MIVYGSSFSPYVRKTLAVIAEKGLETEIKPIALGEISPEFRLISPFGKMPGFRDGDFSISDSSAIITYLEAKHPKPALLPLSPASRARTIWFEEFADNIMVSAMAKLFFNRFVSPRFLRKEGDLAAADKAEAEELPPILDYIEGVIPGSGFLVDDRLTLADLAVANPFINMMHVGFVVSQTSHPKLHDFLEAILSRPSFAAMVAQEKAFAARNSSET